MEKRQKKELTLIEDWKTQKLGIFLSISFAIILITIVNINSEYINSLNKNVDSNPDEFYSLGFPGSSLMLFCFFVTLCFSLIGLFYLLIYG